MIQGWEWIIILVVVLLVFGVGRIGKLGSELGKSVSAFRKGLREGQEEDAGEKNDEVQGETAAELRAERDDFPEGLETFVFWDDGEIRVRSRAALYASRLLGWPWSWGRFLLFIPRFISDAVYRFVARNRIKWFGRTESCWLPPQDQRHRFLP